MSTTELTLLDSADITYAGHPNDLQLAKLDDIVDQDEAVIVIGWHYPSDGPMIVRGDDRWQAVLPDGTLRQLVHRVGRR